MTSAAKPYNAEAPGPPLNAVLMDDNMLRFQSLDQGSAAWTAEKANNGNAYKNLYWYTDHLPESWAIYIILGIYRFFPLCAKYCFKM